MDQFNNSNNNNYQESTERNDVLSKCRQYQMYHVIAHGSDGSQFDGIIESFDNEGVTMLVPEDVTDDYDRQFGGFGGGGFGGGGFGRPRFRRFHRRRFPFSFFFFPFFRPFPFFPF